MTLTVAERNLLKTAGVGECQVRYWLFDPPTLTSISYVSANVNGATNLPPLPLINPRYSLLEPGESVVLSGADSYERGGAAATGHTWTLISGTAVLIPSGNTCTVTPQVPEEVVQVRLTVTASNAQTEYTDAYLVASALGWDQPTGQISLNGGYDAEGWKGSLTIAGYEADASDLAHDKLLLVHIKTLYDGVESTLGGYLRANNLALLRIEDWTYHEVPESGETTVEITLGSPNQALKEIQYWATPGETDGHERGLVFEKNAAGSGFNYAPESGSPDGVVYWSDFRLTDAALWIASLGGAARAFNVSAFHDPNQFGTLGSFILPVDTIWEQIQSTMQSLLCLAFVDYAGSLRLIPSPFVRADEWWGTPSPRWPSDDPLTPDWCLDYTIHYRRDAVDMVTLKGYDDENLPVQVSSTGHVGQPQRVETYDGYILTSSAAAQQWADDLKAMLNRDWDLTVVLPCIGNVLNVGDFTYVNFPPTQPGHTAATGWSVVTALAHSIDQNTNMQVTTADLSPVTNWS